MMRLPASAVFRVNGTGLGRVHEGWLRRVLEPPSPFELDHQGDLLLKSGAESFSSRSAALADWAASARERWPIAGWRDERMVVRDGPTPCFSIERALLRPLGLVLPSVQACAYSLTAAGPRLWIARRSERKPVDPGCLDALVAGGIAGFDTAWSTLIRECEEEAGIPPWLASAARPAGHLALEHRLIDQGLEVTHREQIALHDLELPADFVPRPVDAEHESIMPMSALQAWKSTFESSWTADGARATRALIQRNRWLAGV